MLIKGGSYDLSKYTEQVRYEFSRSIAKAQYEKKYKLRKIHFTRYLESDKAFSILQMTQCAPVKKKQHFNAFLEQSSTLHGIQVNDTIYISPELLFRYVGSKMRKRLRKEVSHKEIRALYKPQGESGEKTN